MSFSGGDTDYEKLFLIEMLIDKVQFLQSSIDSLKDELTAPGNICISFQFLHFPPLKICETDFAYIPGIPDFSNIVLKSGKSCLFSLRSFRCPIKPLEFDIYITVEKSNWPLELEEGHSENIFLGKTVISLGESFTQFMNENLDQSVKELPTAKSINDVFELRDDKGSVIGSISLFSRLSCFGKLIMTQFQLKSDDPDLLLFKGTNYPSIFKQSADQMPGHQQQTAPLPSVSSDTAESRKLQASRDKEYQMETPREIISEGKGMSFKIPEREIRESWKVQKQTVPYYDDRTQVMQMSEYKSYTTYAMHQNTDYDLDLPAGAVGIKDSQVIFQMQKQKDHEKDKKMSPVYYKVRATENGKQKANTVQIIPQDNSDGSNSAIIPSTDDHDVFVLRIGQKSEGSDKKSKLELELRTPKVKEPKPETNSVDTQFPETDGQKRSVGGKNKNTKKGKGGGKGKKGKK